MRISFAWTSITVWEHNIKYEMQSNVAKGFLRDLRHGQLRSIKNTESKDWRVFCMFFSSFGIQKWAKVDKKKICSNCQIAIGESEREMFKIKTEVKLLSLRMIKYKQWPWGRTKGTPEKIPKGKNPKNKSILIIEHWVWWAIGRESKENIEKTQTPFGNQRNDWNIYRDNRHPCCLC